MSANKDDYGEVINGEGTYNAITRTLLLGHSIIIGWTDGNGTHLDVQFSILPIQSGNLQRGMCASTDLFVAVSGFGFFGFKINGPERYPDYVGEKLGLGSYSNSTTERLAELINAVCKGLE